MTAKKQHVARGVATHHHKPFRKRHLVLLVASIGLAIALLDALWLYTISSDLKQGSAIQTIASVFGAQTQTTSSVASTYGYSIKYDTKQYRASAIDATSGELYMDSELTTNRPYDTIHFSRSGLRADQQSAVRITYYPGNKLVQDLATFEKSLVVDKQTNPKELKKGNSATEYIDSIAFLRAEWSRETKAGSVTLTARFISYTGIVNGSPLTAIVMLPLVGQDSSAEAIVHSLTFGDKTQAYVQPSSTVENVKQNSLSLIDILMQTKTASAAGAEPVYATSERLSATYSPAVVKVYNLYKADLLFDGQVAVRGYIDGGTGSGFIVSQNGYIATNGHVVVNNPRDTLISYSLELASKGDVSYIQKLMSLANITQADIAGVSSSQEQVKIIIEKLYTQLSESRFTYDNLTTNLYVGLGEKQADIKEMIEDTRAGRQYSEQPTIKRAKFISADYGGMVLPTYTKKFTNSDVALIKIDITKLPQVKLGSIDSISQGANLNIFGYPGIGSSNGLVSETKTSATLTTGKVSSLKDDNNGKKLIETDTEIGHGNSGGPALSDQGEVVGIATYTIDGSGQGNGVLNYVRSIADFVAIADKENVNYKTQGQTQKEWEEGIGYFYTARYKKAVQKFESVKALYPDHPKVASMIKSAQDHIAKGENIDDFPWVPVLIGGILVSLVGAGVAVVLVRRHHKAHTAYVNGLASDAQPQQPQVPAAPQMTVPGFESSQSQNTSVASPVTSVPVSTTVETSAEQPVAMNSHEAQQPEADSTNIPVTSQSPFDKN